jgi:hypothetical protein
VIRSEFEGTVVIEGTRPLFLASRLTGGLLDAENVLVVRSDLAGLASSAAMVVASITRDQLGYAEADIAVVHSTIRSEYAAYYGRSGGRLRLWNSIVLSPAVAFAEAGASFSVDVSGCLLAPDSCLVIEISCTAPVASEGCTFSGCTGSDNVVATVVIDDSGHISASAPAVGAGIAGLPDWAPTAAAADFDGDCVFSSPTIGADEPR